MELKNGNSRKAQVKLYGMRTMSPRYNDLCLLGRLYSYLEGKAEIDPKSLLRCLTCGLCVDACPETLGIKMLISPARQKWANENGLTDRQTMVDPESKNNLFRKIAELDETPIYKNSPGSVVYFPGCAGTYHGAVCSCTAGESSSRLYCP